MGLAHSRRAVDKERIVVERCLVSAVFGNGLTAGERKFVRASLNEGVEGIVVICEFICLFKLGVLAFKLVIAEDICYFFRLVGLNIDVDVDIQPEYVVKCFCKICYEICHNDILLKIRLDAENSI